MKREQFLRAHLGQPWMMMGDDFAAMLEQMAAGDGVGPRFRDGVYVHPQVQTAGQVAYVPIRGTLMKGCSVMDMCWFDEYDVALLAQQVKNIEDDMNIKHVLFDVDSPGGIAMGIHPVASAIAGLSKKGKKTYGFSSGKCASAAYYLLAGCDQLLATEDSLWGSISTYGTGVDSSKAWEQMGRELILYRTGDLKAVNLPGKPWTEEEREAMKVRIDLLDADFKGFVREKRPQLADESMNGNFWYAKHAPAGLVDGIVGSVEEVLEYLLSKS